MRVVHVKKDKYDVYIGRGKGCIWGNPFVIGKDGTRIEVIEKFKAWILTQPELLARLPELKGKVLGCWCKPQPCHGDVLVNLANEYSQEELRQSPDHRHSGESPSPTEG